MALTTGGGAHGMQSHQNRLQRTYLAVASMGISVAVLCAWGWRTAATTPPRIDTLSAAGKQELLEEVLRVSPGIYQTAYFEPQIGYTLQRSQRLTAWNDTFVSNAFGYRTGLPAKKRGVFRVVFLGDSWTYGMGIQEQESFPKVFERIANEHSGLGRRIEAWTLALPGYNTLNQVAALWFFADRLAPDAVVMCPTMNDWDSANAILPTGSPNRTGVLRDQFGDVHSVIYKGARLLDSYRSRTRWRKSLEQIRETERQLRRLNIPMMLYFAARWDASFVHYLVLDGRLSSPYLVNPVAFTLGDWLNALPVSHGNAKANAIYGRMVYQGLAKVLGWPRLPPARDGSDVSLFRHPPDGQDWKAVGDALLSESTRASIPEHYRPSRSARNQCAGPMDESTGLMGRATTVLVRRQLGARLLQIDVRRVPDATLLYPLPLTVSMPSPSGGTRTVTTVPASGPAVHRFFSAIPDDIAPGAAIDIVFEAQRVTAAPGQLRARSVFIEAIDQVEKR